jgi:hypothetical protein
MDYMVVVGVDAPHVNIPDGTACGVSPAIRTTMTECVFFSSHRQLYTITRLLSRYEA